MLLDYLQENTCFTRIDLLFLYVMKGLQYCGYEVQVARSQQAGYCFSVWRDGFYMNRVLAKMDKHYAASVFELSQERPAVQAERMVLTLDEDFRSIFDDKKKELEEEKRRLLAQVDDIDRKIKNYK
jgi:hypothetical protein